MMPMYRSARTLVLPALVAVLVVGVVDRYGVTEVEHPDAWVMKNAALRADSYVAAIAGEMNRRGIDDSHPDVRGGILIGPEYSPLTTTLGSLEAKLLSLDTRFAALIVRMIGDAGIGPGGKVGVALSGSFPGLGVNVLAALTELNADAVVVSSLGASMFGANRPGMTWADMEHILSDRADMPFRSAFVTRGGEGDAGMGMPDEGILSIEESARRSGRTLVLPASLDEAISARLELFRHEEVELLINIGGNQAMLGSCPHASSLPTGLWSGRVGCDHADRGVLVRMHEQGVRVIHLLNLRGLAERYALLTSPPTVTLVRDRDSVLSLAGVGVILLALLAARRAYR